MGHVRRPASPETGQKGTAKSAKLTVQRKVFISFLASKEQVPWLLRYFMWMREVLRIDMVYTFYVYLQENHKEKINI